MEPGRELDKLIAEKVMGIPTKPTLVKGIGSNFSLKPGAINSVTDFEIKADIPEYSTDISAAHEVVDHLLKTRDWWTEVKHIRPNNAPDRVDWLCDIYTCDFKVQLSEKIERTLPHAICLAALKAVGVEVSSDS